MRLGNKHSITLSQILEDNCLFSGSSSGKNNKPEVVADAKVGDVVIKVAPIIIPDDETNVQYNLKGPKSSVTGAPLFKYNSKLYAYIIVYLKNAVHHYYL